MNTTGLDTPARINGLPLQAHGESLDAETLRQRACTELLRQAAMRAGLLDAQDPPGLNGAISEAASDAIEALLAQQLVLPEPSDGSLPAPLRRAPRALPLWRPRPGAPRAVCRDARHRRAPAT